MIFNVQEIVLPPQDLKVELLDLDLCKNFEVCHDFFSIVLKSIFFKCRDSEL